MAGSLWALFGCGVACLGEASGFGRLSDSRYVLILDLMELVREIPLSPGPDDRTEMGKTLQVFAVVDVASPVVRLKMALLMSLLNPEAKEGRALLGWGGCRISGIG